ncbi:transporter [Exilibacterium tricleocarpae]|uniref:Transporter n=1 Tax=Exilibacterium tricleocarpae TaxID=2591008 RepID=A0A545SQM9_9GAMM|nr:transporter [Exilibacterium tricleocarpae]TQV67284.1 transporter [Exilibacterium tricleocarpae]
MSTIDGVVLAAYITFILAATFGFRKFATDSSQFVNAGGAMVWWMAGSTAFMTQFSAWTFTGAASKAFEDGIAVLVLFWGNAAGFFIAARYFAARYRKLRVETPMQVIRQRFGRPTEQLFTWLQFPLSTIAAAFWLNGLALFTAAVFDISLTGTIVFTGLIVTFIAISGGSWTVSATNVVQLVMLMAVTMVTGGFALYQAGGPTELINRFPVDFIAGSDLNITTIFLFWSMMMLVKQSLSTNNAITCYRFLVTRNEAEAQRAASLAGFLFLVGPVLWFIPPWVVAADNIQLQQAYPNLGANAGNAAYLYFVEHYMPIGTLGLIMAAMIAATIAPMTTALNRNAGIFVRNVYPLYGHAEPSEARLLRIGKTTTLINGLLATLMALIFSTLEGIGFFDLMMLFGALLQMPLAIPALLAVVVRRTPDWAGWSTVLVGLTVSLFMQFGFSVQWLGTVLSEQPLTARESIDLKIATTIAAQALITGGYFCLTRLWFARARNQRGSELARFSMNLRRPLSALEQRAADPRQGLFLGKLLTLLGVATGLLCAFSWSAPGNALFLLMGIAMILAGMGLLRWSAVAAED